MKCVVILHRENLDALVKLNFATPSIERHEFHHGKRQK